MTALRMTTAEPIAARMVVVMGKESWTEPFGRIRCRKAVRLGGRAGCSDLNSE